MKSIEHKAPAVLPGKSLVPLESVLCTEELNRRPARPPDYEKESRALTALAQALADSPRTILQQLAETIPEVFQSDSAGISLLTTDDGGKRFRTSGAARRATLAPAATFSIAAPRCCSGTSNGVTPISCR